MLWGSFALCYICQIMNLALSLSLSLRIIHYIPKLLVVLTSGTPIPPFRVFETGGHAQTDFGKVSDCILGLGQAGLGGLASPQVSLNVALLQHAVRPRQIPAAQGQFALMFALDRGFAVPENALSGIDRTANGAILVRASKPKL